MMLFENITTNKIKSLYLNNNNFYDLIWLNKLDIFSNLVNLDLSFNNIENLSPLTNCKFYNLENLNLFHNKITNINYFRDSHFTSLKYLNLSENEINSGIDEFFLAFRNTSSELILELKCQENYSELFVQYKNNLEIEFKYIIEDKNFNEVLKNISFEGIRFLKLKGFDNNIHFLENITLKSLKILDIIDNNINDLSIFNNIKFIHLSNIYTNRESNIIDEKKCLHVKEGFKYLNFFSLICAEEIYIEKYDDDNKYYICYIYFSDPKLNIYFTNKDFLLDEVLSNSKRVYLSGDLFDTDGYSTNLFSYESLKTYKLPFLRKIYLNVILNF